jgi:hypothetical protein
VRSVMDVMREVGDHLTSEGAQSSWALTDVTGSGRDNGINLGTEMSAQARRMSCARTSLGTTSSRVITTSVASTMAMSCADHRSRRTKIAHRTTACRGFARWRRAFLRVAQRWEACAS